MAVRNRVSHLRKLLQHGALLQASISLNPTTQTDNIKIRVNPQVRVDPFRHQCGNMVLDILDTACSLHHVADQGHTSSRGESTVTFFVSYGKPCPQFAQDVVNPMTVVRAPGSLHDDFDGTASSAIAVEGDLAKSTNICELDSAASRDYRENWGDQALSDSETQKLNSLCLLYDARITDYCTFASILNGILDNYGELKVQLAESESIRQVLNNEPDTKDAQHALADIFCDVQLLEDSCNHAVTQWQSLKDGTRAISLAIDSTSRASAIDGHLLQVQQIVPGLNDDAKIMSISIFLIYR